MINLFENYSQGSWDLHYSLIVAGYVNTTVCLSDDGFLPSDVTSPYLYSLVLTRFKDLHFTLIKCLCLTIGKF